MEHEGISERCARHEARPDLWGMSRSPLFASRELQGKPPDLRGMRHQEPFRSLKIPIKSG
jgi:hypothetical protein